MTLLPSDKCRYWSSNMLRSVCQRNASYILNAIRHESTRHSPIYHSKLSLIFLRPFLPFFLSSFLLFLFSSLPLLFSPFSTDKPRGSAHFSTSPFCTSNPNQTHHSTQLPQCSAYPKRSPYRIHQAFATRLASLCHTLFQKPAPCPAFRTEPP